MDVAFKQCKSDIQCLAEKLNLKKWSYEIESGDNLGENYFGLLIPVVIKTESKCFNIMFKYPPINENLRLEGPVTEMFDRETEVYTRIINKFEEIQENFNIENKLIVPNIIFSRKEYLLEVLVLKDMRSEGYNLSPNKLFLNFKQIEMALMVLAKMHALSFIFEEKYSKTFQDNTDFLCHGRFKGFEMFMEILKKSAIDISERFQKESTQKSLLQCGENVKQNMQDLYYKAKRTVICHGDAWRNNILFKIIDNRVVSACLVDFQACRLMSPAYDVLHCILCTTTQDVRRMYFHKLLDSYYNSLRATLAEVGMLATDIYTFDDLKKDLKMAAPSCLVVANFSFLQWFGVDECPLMPRTQNIHLRKRKEAWHQFQKTVESIVDDLSDFGYL